MQKKLISKNLLSQIFYQKLEEFCISAELVLNRGGVISVLDELFLSSFIKSKKVSLIFRLPKEVDLPSGAILAQLLLG